MTEDLKKKLIAKEDKLKKLNLKLNSLKQKRINLFFELFGHTLFFVQMVEWSLKIHIQSNYLKNKKPLPNNLDDLTLGQLISELDKIIIKTDKNKILIAQLKDFNKLRIKFIHKIFDQFKLPRRYEAFINKLIMNKKFNNDLKKLTKLGMDCTQNLNNLD